MLPAHLIAKQFGLPLGAVLGKSRAGRLPEARHWAWWWTVTRDGTSRVDAGHLFGVDESSIRHAVRKCDRAIRTGRIPPEMEEIL